MSKTYRIVTAGENAVDGEDVYKVQVRSSLLPFWRTVTCYRRHQSAMNQKLFYSLDEARKAVTFERFCDGYQYRVVEVFEPDGEVVSKWKKELKCE